MSFALPLPEPWASRGWKAKIRDKERLEPPHVTLLHKTRAWRIGLRDLRFLDDSPPPKDVSGEVFKFVEENVQALREAWDRMYPENPVELEEDDA
jgi:hypothetical protein